MKNEIPDLGFGKAGKLPDWREHGDEEDEDEDAPIESVSDLLGFDPSELEEAEDGAEFEEGKPIRNVEAHDSLSLAYDRSARTFDEDGRLHVALTNISKATVNPYYGHEIPGFEELGLDPERKYKMLRAPDELEKGAATFNNLPLLIQHQASSATDHPQGLTVGSTGTDAVFNAPYLQNSLVVWVKDAIDAIESEDKKELSCGYRYRPDMTPGTYEGEPYDGVMRDIVGNHVALCREGRAGHDVVVGDHAMRIKLMGKQVMTRQAAIAIGVLAPYVRSKLAQDQKIDLRPLFKGITADNYHDVKPKLLKGIQRVTRGKLAKDASIGELAELLDLIDSHEVEEDAGEEATPMQSKAMQAAAEGGPPEYMEEDAEPAAALEGFLKGKLSDEDLAHCMSLLHGEEADDNEAEGEEKLEDLGAAKDRSSEEEEDEAEDEPAEREEMAERIKAGGAKDRKRAHDKYRHRVHDRRRAQDQPPPFKGMPQVGKGPVDKKAMDSAISAAVSEAKKQARQLEREIRVAERFVRPWTGDLVLDEAESAEDVYRMALDALDVEIEGVHPSAYAHILKLQPLPGVRSQSRASEDTRRTAMDAKSVDSFSTMFPDAMRILPGA